MKLKVISLISADGGLERSGPWAARDSERDCCSDIPILLKENKDAKRLKDVDQGKSMKMISLLCGGLGVNECSGPWAARDSE